MPDYRVRLSKAAGKELDRFPAKIAERIVGHIEDLGRAPSPSGSLRLKGSTSWRIRVGDYRVIYPIDDDGMIVTILYVRLRKEAYRGL